MPEEDETERLLAQAERRLTAAHSLLEGGFFDDAISRAYYSMYFAASALFLTRDICIKTHKGLIARFGLEFVEGGVIERHYGRAFKIAGELRSEADYSITREISEEEAKQVVDDAKEFLARIRIAIMKGSKGR